MLQDNAGGRDVNVMTPFSNYIILFIHYKSDTLGILTIFFNYNLRILKLLNQLLSGVVMKGQLVLRITSTNQ